MEMPLKNFYDREADKAVEYDLNTNSISECMFSPALQTFELESYSYTLQAIAATTIIGSVQESFNNTIFYSDKHKEIVSEGVKVSFEKYWTRFKLFLSKIRNLIVRTFIRVTGYIRKLVGKVLAKLAVTFNEDRLKEEKLYPNNIFVGYPRLRAKLDTFKFNEVLNTKDADFNRLINVKKIDKRALDNMEKYSKNTEKEDIINFLIGDTARMKAGDFGTPQQIIHDLNNVSSMYHHIDKAKNQVLKSVDRVESSVKMNQSLDVAVMKYRMKMTHKLLVMYNSTLSALSAVGLLWITNRYKALRAYLRTPEEEKEIPYKYAK